MKTKQLRIRVSPQIAAQFEGLPPRARGQAVSLVLGAWASGLDLRELLKLRQVVVNAGNLLNQSPRDGLAHRSPTLESFCKPGAEWSVWPGRPRGGEGARISG